MDPECQAHHLPPDRSTTGLAAYQSSILFERRIEENNEIRDCDSRWVRG